MFLNNFSYSKTLKNYDTKIRFSSKKRLLEHSIKKDIQLDKNSSCNNLSQDNIKSQNSQMIESKNEKDTSNSKFSIIRGNLNLSVAINKIFNLPELAKYKNEKFLEKGKEVNNSRLKIKNAMNMKSIQGQKDKFKKYKNFTMNYVDDDNELAKNNEIDIFDENFEKNRKKRHKKNELELQIEKVKQNNMKIESKFQLYKKVIEKYRIRNNYYPNYSYIDKHLPSVNLNSKSIRAFPDQIIKQYMFNNEKEYVDKKDIKKKKLKKISKRSSSLNICDSFKDKSLLLNIINNIKTKKDNNNNDNPSSSILSDISRIKPKKIKLINIKNTNNHSSARKIRLIKLDWNKLTTKDNKKL